MRHLYARGIYSKGYVVVIKIPLVLNDGVRRVALCGSTAVKGHGLCRRRRVGTGRHHRHRYVLIDAQGGTVGVAGPETVGHPHPDRMSNTKGHTGQLRPRYRRRTAHRVVVQSVIIEIPGVRDDRITVHGVRITGTSGVQHQVVTRREDIRPVRVGHRRPVALVDHHHQRIHIAFRRNVIVGHAQRRVVDAECGIGVRHLCARGIYGEGYGVVVKIPLVLNDTVRRVVLCGSTGVKGHGLCRRRRVGTGRHHRHRRVEIDAQIRGVGVGQTEAVGHSQSNSISTQSQSRQIRPRYYRRCSCILEAAVITKIPFVENDAIATARVRIG